MAILEVASVLSLYVPEPVEVRDPVLHRLIQQPGSRKDELSQNL